MLCVVNIAGCEAWNLFSVYCAFIDYSKAFDTVDKTLLWQKLLSLNIDGNVLMS